ncbi:MAG: zinc-finger domain-containing protein [Alphaproteobacteria bacterium]
MAKPQEAPEIIDLAADADGVMCDGGGGALGHPAVWYSFDKQNSVRCGYCDRLFRNAV